jgi:hypothetical protein
MQNELSSAKLTSRSASSTISHKMMMMIECCDHSYFNSCLINLCLLGYFLDNLLLFLFFEY